MSHIASSIRQYHGDPHARWDGDTLIVDTTNYVANATRVGAQREAAHHRDVPACVSGHARVIWLAALSASLSSAGPCHASARAVGASGEVPALFLGCGYALIGRRDDGLRWLRGAVQQGFINYPFFTRVWFLESLRGDAEDEALMQ